MPADMQTTTHPLPSEIAVDDINNPSIAYTASTNIYNLYGQNETGAGAQLGSAGEFIKLAMKNCPNYANYPLFGSTETEIGRSTGSVVTNNLDKQYWWKLIQTNTSITNAQDAKYTIYSGNNTSSLSLRENAGNPDWGLFASGVEELRLIPASDVPPIVASVVEWGQNAAILEASPTKNSVTATSIVGTLNGTSSSAITLSKTGTSVKGSDTKYNFTVNFGEGINFAADESNGAMLLLEWKNGESVVGISNIVVPKIVAASATMSSLIATDDPWKTEVHVLPGVTLTANAGSFSSGDVKINQLEIYPGATVKVTTGILDVASLVLRNGWKRITGGTGYDVARVYINSSASMKKSNQTDSWYVDWYIDYDQYYPIAVPFPVSITDHPYKNAVGLSYDGNLMLRYYDGEQRADNGQTTVGQNWKKYGEDGNAAYPRTLEPSKAYAMSAKRPTGRAFSIIRMPMTYTKPADMNPWLASGEQGVATITSGETHKNQVNVTGWGIGTSTPWYAIGWNFIGNPYMSVFNGNDDGIAGVIEYQNGGSVKYATIPDLEFKNFYQVPIAEADLKPASGFFIQANNADPQTITFNASKIVPPSVPARYKPTNVTIPEQEAYIRLSNGEEKDLMGLIIGADYTEAYEPNADLAKMLGEANAVKTYMRYGEMDMAYVAINETLAKQWIPITVKIPAAGEYTFSLSNSSSVEALEGIYLTDYEENQTVNLIEQDYVFSSVAGTFAERFAINAIVGERQTPTDVDATNGGTVDPNTPIKFLYHEKVYILYQGVIYDAVGKKVTTVNK